MRSFFIRCQAKAPLLPLARTFRAVQCAGVAIPALLAAASAHADSFAYTGSIVTYTVSTTGLYSITAYGAQGGASAVAGAGGLGAEAGGRITLTAGEVISIVVGGAGGSGARYDGAGGGGGGSFVVVQGANTPLVIAGGGGGGGFNTTNGGSGSAAAAGGAGAAAQGYSGGSGGASGAGGAAGAGNYGGGGGGLTSSGAGAGGGDSGAGGAGFSSGLAGGTSSSGGAGGFGGGGGGGYDGGGGGGGYSGGGGGGGTSGGGGAGGGGGSYVDASATGALLLAGVESGNGLVTIVQVANISGTGTSYNASNLGSSVNSAFQGGTLVMNQNGTYAQNFTLDSSSSNTIDQHGATSIFSGAFTDATTGGAIVIANSGSGGSVTFSGQNTYTGSTTVNSGAKLMLSGAGGIAASSGLVDNGVFDISGVASGASVTTLSGNGSVVLGGSALTLTNANGVFSGSITGTGGLIIAGGSETLTGASTFASTIINSGGVLIVNGSITDPTVNSGGTLSGVGSVGATTVNAGGTLAPGSGVAGTSLTVNGTLAFQAGAIYQVQVNPSTASYTTVNGAATLGGATVSAIFANGSYISKVYTILTASGGVSGTFASTVVDTNLPANFKTTLSYDANDAYLNLNLNFSTPAAATLNTNQLNVATALTNYFNTTGGIPLAFGAMSAAQLTAIDGEAATGAERGAFDMMNRFLGLMVDPFADGRNPAAFGAAAFDTASPQPHSAEAAFTQNWSAWSAGFGGLNRANGDAAQGSNSIVARDYGYAAGLDYRLAPNSVIGFAFAGGGLNWGLAQGLGSGSGTTFQAGVYGATHFNSVYVSADFAFANHWLKTARNALGDQLTAAFAAQDFGGRIEAGYRFNLPTPDATIAVTPYAALQLQKYSAPSYSEADPSAGGFGLNYSSANETDVRSELGGRFDAPTRLGDLPFTLRGRVAWAHDTIGSPTLNATLQALSGANFTVYGAPLPHDTALASVGAELRIADGWLLSAKFDGEFARGAQSYAGSAALRYTW